MYKTFLLTFLLFFVFFGNLVGQDVACKFNIEVYQDNKLVELKDGVLELKKKPFVFKVTLWNVEYLEVSASFERFYYDFPSDKNIYDCDADNNYEECRFMGGKSCAESTFNKSKKLIVGGKDSHLCWFYDTNLDWHRFDKKIKVDGAIVLATKTIKHILDVEIPSDSKTENGYSYPITKIAKDIFLVFAISDHQKNSTTPQELQREKFVIRFIN